MAGEAVVDRNLRRRAGAFVLASLVAVVIAVAPVAPPEAGADTVCGGLDGLGIPVAGCNWTGGEGDGDGGDGGSGGGGGGGSGERPDCVWVAFDPADGLTWTDHNGNTEHWTEEDLLEDLESWDEEPPPAGEDVVWWRLVCGATGTPCPPGVYGLDAYELCSAYDTRSMWVPTPEPVPPGTPAETYLVNSLWVQVAGQLTEPEPVLDPPEGAPAVVQVPTFAAVENPPEDGRDTACIAVPGDVVCVTMVWETSMWYDPGDGAGRIPCEPPGTRFDPAAGSPASQAGPGTCTHVYTRHTPGGPYGAAIGFTWDFRWSSSSGWSGTFDPIDRSTSFSRDVDEVQSIVTDVEMDG